MANIKPGFITGANARVKLGGKLLAYCTDLNYTVDVATIPIEVIGTYEVKSYEPIAYSVNGSFSVVRYTSRDNINGIRNAAAGGNPAVDVGGAAASGTSVGTHLDPGKILTSSTFDIEVHQVASNDAATSSAATGVFKITDCRIVRRTSSLSKRGVVTDGYSFVGVMAGDVDVETTETVSHSGQLDLA